MRNRLLCESHSEVAAGHFASNKLFQMFRCHWWWPRIYHDVVEYCQNGAECAVVSGRCVPPLNPVPVQCILGVDIMELTTTSSQGNLIIPLTDDDDDDVCIHE